MPSLRILVLFFSINVVFGLYEDVVVKILDKLSQEKNVRDSKSIRYTVPLRADPDPKLTVSLNYGKISLTKISLDKEVDYFSDDSTAGFNFTANVELSAAYKYNLLAFESTISTGNATSEISTPMDLEIDLSQENCTMRLAGIMNFNMELSAEIKPFDNFLFPATVELAPGHPVGKSLRNEIIDFLMSIFERRLCDCLDCF